MSRLFLRLFEFKVSTLGQAVILLRVHQKIGVGVYKNTVEIKQDDQMAF